MAALAPIIKSKAGELVSSISLIFLLNLIAIVMFPYLGHFLGMTESEFGIFAALTIYDTASVIGASSIYGEESVVYASVIKLGRTLWIIPTVILFSLYFRSQEAEYELPYFILFFLGFVLLGSFIDLNQDAQFVLKKMSNTLFLLGLFFIGLKFDLKTLRDLSIRPIIFALILWLIIICLTIVVFHV